MTFRSLHKLQQTCPPWKNIKGFKYHFIHMQACHGLYALSMQLSNFISLLYITTVHDEQLLK